jgi:hypothetical protein
MNSVLGVEAIAPLEENNSVSASVESPPGVMTWKRGDLTGLIVARRNRKKDF